MSNVVNIKEYQFSEKMLRAKDLKRIFSGVSQSTYETWVRKGLINRYKIGGGVFYKLSEVEQLIENSRECI